MNYQVVADESVDFRIVTELRQNGLSVYSIAEQQPSILDEDVLQVACMHNALLITEDKDFGELVFRFQLPHKGVLLIRLEGEKLPIQITSLAVTILKYLEEMQNNFSVLNHSKLRIRDQNQQN